MSEVPTPNFIPEGFSYADGATLQEKISRFVGAGVARLHVVLDFDHTLTSYNPDEDVNSWSALSRHLTDDAQARYDERYKHYIALEAAENLTVADAVEWWSGDLDMLVEQQINLRDVERNFPTQTNARPGAVDMLGTLQKHSVPSVILSAGIRNVIELWGKTYDVQPTLIIAAGLETDSDTGQIIGWDKRSLVHTLNKREADHPELSSIRRERPMALLVGNSMNDADMASDDGDVLRIRVHEPWGGHTVDMTQVRETTFTRFDALLESGDLFPVQQLIQLIANSSPS